MLQPHVIHQISTNPPDAMPSAFIITLIGASASGKTTLAHALHAALQTGGRRVALVAAPATSASPDCAGAQQQLQIEAARWGHDLIIIDSPAMPLRSDLTLLMALDLPADAARLPARRAQDADLRSALLAAGQGWSVIAGHGPSRLQAALAAHAAERRRRQPSAATTASRWQHVCGRCGDPDCERHLLDRARSTGT